MPFPVWIGNAISVCFHYKYMSVFFIHIEENIHIVAIAKCYHHHYCNQSKRQFSVFLSLLAAQANKPNTISFKSGILSMQKVIVLLALFFLSNFLSLSFTRSLYITIPIHHFLFVIRLFHSSISKPMNGCAISIGSSFNKFHILFIYRQ